MFPLFYYIVSEQNQERRCAWCRMKLMQLLGFRLTPELEQRLKLPDDIAENDGSNSVG